MPSAGKAGLVICLTDDPFVPPARGAFGGSVNVMFNLGAFLVRRGHSICFLSTNPKIEKPAREELSKRSSIWRIPIKDENGHEVSYNNFDRFVPVVTEFCLSAYEIDGRPIFDFLISYNWNSGLVACDLARQWGVRHIHFVLALAQARLRAGESSRKVTPQWQIAEERIFREADHVVAASSNEVAEIISLYPTCNPARLTCIHLGINVDVFSPRPRPLSDYVRWASSRFAERSEEIS